MLFLGQPLPLAKWYFSAPADSAGHLIAQILLASAFVAFVLFLLHRLLAPRGKRWVIVVVTFLGGLYYTFEYFTPGELPRSLVFLRGVGLASLGGVLVYALGRARTRTGRLVAGAFLAALIVCDLIFNVGYTSEARARLLPPASFLPIGAESAALAALAAAALGRLRRHALWLLPACYVAGRAFTLMAVAYAGADPEKDNFLTPFVSSVGDTVTVIGAFTVGLGILSLSLVHGRQVLRFRRGWHNSLAFFAGFVAMSVVGIWQSLLDSPSHHQHAPSQAAVVVDNRLYLLGGYGGRAADEVCQANLESELSLWRVSPRSLPAKVTGLTAAALDDRIFSIGGYETGVREKDQGPRDSVWVAQLGPDGEIAPWQRSRTLPQPLHRAVALTAGDQLLVIGGETTKEVREGKETAKAPVVLDTVYSASLEAGATLGRWRKLVSLPRPLRDHAALVAGDLVLVLGGWNQETGESDAIFAARLRPEGGLGQWKEIGKLPSPLSEMAAIAYPLSGEQEGPPPGERYRLLLFGGFDGMEIQAKVWAAELRLSPAGAESRLVREAHLSSWQAGAALPPQTYREQEQRKTEPVPLAAAAAAVFGNRVFLIGGFGGFRGGEYQFETWSAALEEAGLRGAWREEAALPQLAAAVRNLHFVLFYSMFKPLGAAMFALLAFYIASAAYRSFRVRTGEATLMMAAAFIVMLGQIPLGMWLTNWIPQQSELSRLRVEELSHWVLGWVSMAALRGVLLGIAVGALAMSLRVWLSLERGTFFSQERQ